MDGGKSLERDRSEGRVVTVIGILVTRIFSRWMKDEEWSKWKE